METQKKAVSVEEYRSRLNVPKMVTLPECKMDFKVKKITILDLVGVGITEIPNEFHSFISTLGSKTEVDSEKNKKNWELFEKFLNVTLDVGCIEPKVTFKFNKETASTHLLYSELSSADQKFLINEILGR